MSLSPEPLVWDPQRRRPLLSHHVYLLSHSPRLCRSSVPVRLMVFLIWKSECATSTFKFGRSISSIKIVKNYTKIRVRIHAGARIVALLWAYFQVFRVYFCLVLQQKSSSEHVTVSLTIFTINVLFLHQTFSPGALEESCVRTLTMPEILIIDKIDLLSLIAQRSTEKAKTAGALLPQLLKQFATVFILMQTKQNIQKA